MSGEKILSASANIDANVGCLSGLDYQDNGTQRFKGSFPQLVTDPLQILNHLKTELPPLIKEYGNRVSRLSSRYFVTQEGLSELSNLLESHQVDWMHLQLEAALPLGNIFEQDGIKSNISWIWVGGNHPLRTTDPKILKHLKQRFQTSLVNTTPHACPSPDKHHILILGTPDRLQALRDKEIPPGVHLAEISSYAKQIAKLYSERFKVYVADNGNPEYIANIVADSLDTTIFATVNPRGEIEAVVSNELTRYPVKLPDGKDKEITTCETNDVVRKRGAHQQSLPATMTAAMTNAVKKTHGIEIECVPEAFKTAGQSGFQPMGVLERTSYMITDGSNVELQDTSIPEEYRKFNSLFLYWMSPLNSAWQFWQNYDKTV